MGKVLSKFGNGFAGAVARAADDIIVSFPNSGEAAIPFGAPVFLQQSSGGAVPFSSDLDMTTFLGFAARSGAKTPDVYGESTGAYQPGEIMDVLTRGTVVVEAAGNPAPGGAVYIRLDNGKITASAGTAGSTLELTNCRFRGNRDGKYMAEVLVRTRNIG